MSRLRCAVELFSQRHNWSKVITMLNSVISTSTPKPNFSNREMITLEPAHIPTARLLSETEVVKDTSNTSKINNKNDNESENAGGANANVPKATIKDNPLPAVTIVDVNSGYGRMDFEERMEHMDRVESINDAKVQSDIASKLTLPIIKPMPTVVDINGYGDDMMYEDKPELGARQEQAAKPNEELAGSSDVGSNLMPVSNDEQQLPLEAGKKQREQREVATVKEEVLKSAISGNDMRLIVPEDIVNDGKIVAAQVAAKSTASDVEEICVAPVDIDAYANEEEKKQGTVDIDAFGDDERMQLPPIPKVRNNVFEFKGIKIIMPRRMLRDATYRYRLDPSDKDKPDDIQICLFRK